jgi:hypothetical protein
MTSRNMGSGRGSAPAKASCAQSARPRADQLCGRSNRIGEKRAMPDPRTRCANSAKRSKCLPLTGSTAGSCRRSSSCWAQTRTPKTTAAIRPIEAAAPTIIGRSERSAGLDFQDRSIIAVFLRHGRTTLFPHSEFPGCRVAAAEIQCPSELTCVPAPPQTWWRGFFVWGLYTS